VKGVQDIIKAYEKMAEYSDEFSSSLNKTQNELALLVEQTDRERKQTKQSGLADEQRVQDAERQMERAKAKYDLLAPELNRVRSGTSSRRITLRGLKLTEQSKEELYYRVNVADEDHRVKMANAQQLRRDLESNLRPRTVRYLKSLILTIDTALTTQMQELGTVVLCGVSMCLH
jgi:Rho GTPase-activating protein RGD1